MDEAIIRHAGIEDTEKIMAMVREMDTSDYLQEIWPTWVQNKRAVNLVTLVGGHIAACLHGRMSAGQDAWAQGLRVTTGLRRRGIATSLLTALEEELRRKGARNIFATISRFNPLSLATVTKLDWKVAYSIIRRRLKMDSSQSAVKILSLENQPSLDLCEICRIVCLSGVLASRRTTAFFRRMYSTMTEEFLREALATHVVRTNTFPEAVAILNKEPAENRGLWVIALSGAPSGMVPLLINLTAEAGQAELDLVVDSSDDPEIQAVLDDLGFEPAGKDGQFIVVKKELLPSLYDNVSERI
jgi:N-acetylglutamate synthase-like GNAT family acetyltransferase